MFYIAFRRSSLTPDHLTLWSVWSFSSGHRLICVSLLGREEHIFSCVAFSFIVSLVFLVEWMDGPLSLCISTTFDSSISCLLLSTLTSNNNRRREKKLFFWFLFFVFFFCIVCVLFSFCTIAGELYVYLTFESVCGQFGENKCYILYMWIVNATRFQSILVIYYETIDARFLWIVYFCKVLWLSPCFLFGPIYYYNRWYLT